MQTIKLGSCFSGIGCFELAAEHAIPNSETAWQIEIEPFARRVLSRHWPRTKRYEDIRRIDTNKLEPIDLLIGGFPCQDASQANLKRDGLDGKKSGLWFEMLRILRDIRTPNGKRPVLVAENVTGLLNVRPGIDQVLGSLYSIGYDAESTCLSAGSIGGPHRRDRIWIVGYATNPNDRHEYDLPINGSFESTSQSNRFDQTLRRGRIQIDQNPWSSFATVDPICRKNDGSSEGIHRSNRRKSLGNSIVPQVAIHVFNQLRKNGMLP